MTTWQQLQTMPAPASWTAMCEANALFVLGKADGCPYRPDLPPEWAENRAAVARINRRGFLTVDGQQGGKNRAADRSGRHVILERRAFVTGFMPADRAEALFSALVSDERFIMFKALPPVHPVDAAAVCVSLVDGAPAGFVRASATGPLSSVIDPTALSVGDLQSELELASVAVVDLRWLQDSRHLFKALDYALA